MDAKRLNAEQTRLAEQRDGRARWRLWGPYLAERQWGTVREDYSASGSAWDAFPHDHARSRAYRWGEDGLLGLCDEQGLLCFAPALWNGRDPILKERLFGLTNSEGNHGEDVRACSDPSWSSRAIDSTSVESATSAEPCASAWTRAAAYSTSTAARTSSTTCTSSTSFFPSSGAVNPSLTIMANALRVGDHLIERMKVRTAA